MTELYVVMGALAGQRWSVQAFARRSDANAYAKLASAWAHVCACDPGFDATRTDLGRYDARATIIGGEGPSYTVVQVFGEV